MLTIDRSTGAVSGTLSPEEREALWRAIFQNIGPKVLEDQMKNKPAASNG